MPCSPKPNHGYHQTPTTSTADKFHDTQATSLVNPIRISSHASKVTLLKSTHLSLFILFDLDAANQMVAFGNRYFYGEGWCWLWLSQAIGMEGWTPGGRDLLFFKPS